MNKHEKQAIEKYDSISAYYDSTFDGKFTARFKSKMLEFCDVTDGDRILDVGCGSGSLLYAISQKAAVLAHGVDISPRMINECRNRYTNLIFDVSNGENLNFPDGNFDMVTICCALHHLNNPENFFSEARRVLKPGGKLVVAEPWFPPGIRHFVDFVVSPLMKAGDNRLFTNKKLKRLFAGFEITAQYKKGFVQILCGQLS